MTDPLKIYARGPSGVAALEGKPGPGFGFASKTLHPGKQVSPFAFNTTGDRYTVIEEEGVALTDSSTDSVVATIPLPRVIAVAFSPKGTYVVIFQKPTADSKGEKNLLVFNLSNTSEPVLSLFQKGFAKEAWPTLHWSSDEAHVFRLVNNEVHVYASADFNAGIAARLRCQGISALSVAPGGRGEDAVFSGFVAEAKGAPGRVMVHSLSQLKAASGEKSPPPQPLARRSFFKCSEVKMFWNSPGTAVLVLATTDVDKSNQSYYGESNLHFLKADGSHEGGVPLGKEGPIHAVQWSPQGKLFCTLYGFMPAQATLFSDSCRPLQQIAAKPWNTIAWSPQGRFLALAGFGNLPGDIEFFEVDSKEGKAKSLGQCRQACVVTIEWSPCGRHLLIATTAPRLRVDNNFKVLSYRGEVEHEQACETLFDAVWKPAPPGTFPDRPASPPKQGKPGASQQNQGSQSGRPGSAAAGGASRPQSAKPAAYRPPHMQGGIPGAGPPPGAESGGGGESKSAAKNRKKREAAAKKKAEAGGA